MKLMTARGVRDFAPEDKILRNKVVEKLKIVFEKYGYSPLETPLVERLEVLTAKAGGNADADVSKEMFTFKDQGERSLGLRFELTLSFARFIGMNPSMKLPFKRYEFGPVFRDGPIKLGRYRQFWQCDVDVVGAKVGLADSELIALALDVFDSLEVDAELFVNNRKILKGIIQYAGIDLKEADSVIISIDKLDKIGPDGVREELESKGLEDTQIAKALSVFSMSGSASEKFSMLRGILKDGVGKEGLDELELVLSHIKDKRVIFNPSLARGLGYYTGTIFEGYVKNSKVTSSICGGGRYDEMISKLLNSDKEYPCIGISFGLDILNDVMKESKQSAEKTVTEVFVIPIKTEKECFKIVQDLRKKGIKADLDIMQRGISKNLDFANAQGISYVIFAGQRELDEGKVKLKNMVSGKEEMLSLKDVFKKLK